MPKGSKGIIWAEWGSGLTGCGKTRRGREKLTSGAEAPTPFQRLSGPTEVGPSPKPARVILFPQPARETGAASSAPTFCRLQRHTGRVPGQLPKTGGYTG